MEKSLWKKYQMFIDGGLIELVVDALVKEITDNLTPKQMKPLGDIRSKLLKMFPSDNGVTAEMIVKQIINLARKGYIKGAETEPHK